MVIFNIASADFVMMTADAILKMTIKSCNSDHNLDALYLLKKYSLKHTFLLKSWLKTDFSNATFQFPITCMGFVYVIANTKFHHII